MPGMLDDAKDYVGDLVHRAVDTVSGALSKPSEPAKPPATSEDATKHLGGYWQKDRQAVLDKQIADAGG